jgi:co-chaperonin GroES (HSP10)
MGIHKLQIVDAVKRILAYNPLGKNMLSRHPRQMLEIKRLIQKDGFNIPHGAIKITKSGIVIQRLANGSYKGNGKTTATFRIQHGKKVFFIKYKKNFEKNQIIKYAQTRTLFENKKINGYTVRVLMPHIIYGENKPSHKNTPADFKPTFIVTDYFDTSKGTLYDDYFNQNFATRDQKVVQELDQLSIARKHIENLLEKNHISTEQRHLNMFVVPGKKTLWLFDLD